MAIFLFNALSLWAKVDGAAARGRDADRGHGPAVRLERPLPGQGRRARPTDHAAGLAGQLHRPGQGPTPRPRTTSPASNQLYLPKDRPVRVQVRSMDVIHSFFLPNFRVKQDAMPGMTDRHLVHAQGGGRLRDRLRRALRPRPLPDARAGARGARGRSRQGRRRGRPVDPWREKNAWPTPRPTPRRRTPTTAPQAFIWKYVFSKDHKVIGIQYYVTAMLMALIAGLLAMLIRVQLAWPEVNWPAHRQAPARWASGRRGVRDEPRVLRDAVHDARHDHGVLRALHRARERLRQPADPAAGRRARHGLPVPERPQLLDVPLRLRRRS